MGVGLGALLVTLFAGFTSTCQRNRGTGRESRFRFVATGSYPLCSPGAMGLTPPLSSAGMELARAVTDRRCAVALLPRLQRYFPEDLPAGWNRAGVIRKRGLYRPLKQASSVPEQENRCRFVVKTT